MIQRQIKHTGIVPHCICGREPKAYCIDGKQYTFECHPCQNITVRLSTYKAAKLEFVRMMRVIKEDRQSHEPVLHAVR